MREIEFRIWHPKWDRMIYSDRVNCYEKRDFYPFIFAIGFSHYPKDGGWKLMQFTGLNDKSGKEIYEKDIITIDWSEKAWQIVRNYAQFDIQCDSQQMSLNDCDPEEIGIIGNIHENPELL